MNLQEQILDQLSATMSAEMDREILWGMMVELGWHRVSISRLQDNNHAIDITYWLEEKCQGAYEREGREFIFELGTDATMFTLKWVA
jgi:hypothetical protein